EEQLDEHDQPLDGAVSVHRHEEATLSNTVIFPITEQQRNGLEDLRLTRFDHGGGNYEWVGTYTAYSGHSIRSELLRTRDFKHFELEPIAGRAGRNKGMALFPEKIGGQFAMVGRQDGKNLYLIRSDSLTSWDDDGVLLMEPKYPWEFIQIGNCGPPIRTDQGWLLITHGVGAMRKYALGCALLDLEDPSRVIARSARPVLTAVDADRAGYVPNVIYTCGALLTGRQLFVPYGISDSAVGFATCPLETIMALME
ncbi:MAG TPA: glycosidase, partial [Novosphingobium sp.]|nr:glycosidase [Novosphingobium sp.]